MNLQFQRLIALALVASMSLCCCHLNTITAALSGDGTAAVGQATSVDSCCSRHVSDSKVPCEDESSHRGCKDCCIKGTGLKDMASAIPSFDLTAELPEFSWPVLAQPEKTGLALADTGHRAALAVEPHSLVRLHCALIV